MCKRSVNRLYTTENQLEISFTNIKLHLLKHVLEVLLIKLLNSSSS